MRQPDSLMAPTRRAVLRYGLAASALLTHPFAAFAASAGFDKWREQFHKRATAKGVSEATWNRVMAHLAPDTGVFKEMGDQPEFKEEIWQYINRRVSDWRIIAGKEALKKNEALFTRIEHDFGVERGTLLALWGVESAYGDPLVQQNHMRPVFPSLAALAWNEPRRRAYWESELINALKIVAGAPPRKCEVPGPARWGIRNGCRRSGSTSEWITTATAGSHRSASPTT